MLLIQTFLAGGVPCNFLPWLKKGEKKTAIKDGFRSD